MLKFLLIPGLLALLFQMPAWSQKIFKVQYESQADVKVYVVKYESQCDLKVYLVDYESQAGWRNPEKMHLLMVPH
jgi:hypothetical protein